MLIVELAINASESIGNVASTNLVIYSATKVFSLTPVLPYFPEYIYSPSYYTVYKLVISNLVICPP